MTETAESEELVNAGSASAVGRTPEGQSRLARIETPASGGAMAETLLDALGKAQSSARSRSHGLRFVDVRERETLVTWGEVVERAQRTAAELRDIGVERGDRVALIFSTGPEFFDGFFGALLAGAVPVPLYPPVRLGKMDQYDQRTANMLLAANARVVLVEARVARLLGGVTSLFAPALGVLTPNALGTVAATKHSESSGRRQSESSQASAEHAVKQQGAVEQLGPESLAAAPSAGDLALVQFSSGTTVEPKPVALSHAALLHQASILAGHWPDTEGQEQSGVSWLPLYHDMGLIGCVIPALLRVANLWLIPPEVFLARPALWLRTLSRSRATVSPAPNFAYSLCVERVRDKDLEGVDLSAWRAALNGAEAVSIETVRAFTDRFTRFGFKAQAMTPVYGLAEAALAVTFSDLLGPPVAERFERLALSEGRACVASHAVNNTSASVELVSVGRPVPGFVVEVRAENGDVAVQGREGEVFTKGPSLLSGYLGKDQKLHPALVDGWLATGDLGFIHEGNLFLTGRKKDVLVLHGRNWSPVPIEEAVSAVEGIRTGCVVAVSGLLTAGGNSDGSDSGGSERAGVTERLWVIAETRAASAEFDALVEASKAAVRSGLGLVVARVDLVEPGEIPRTSSGKLRRAAAKTMAEAGRLQAAGSAGLGDRIRRQPAIEAALALLHSRRKG